MSAKTTLALKPMPDGLGFIYGMLISHDGTSYRIDIMPPLPHWRGDIQGEGTSAPHPTDWVIYVDGDEIARVAEKIHCEAAAIKWLQHHMR